MEKIPSSSWRFLDNIQVEVPENVRAEKTKEEEVWEEIKKRSWGWSVRQYPLGILGPGQGGIL